MTATMTHRPATAPSPPTPIPPSSRSSARSRIAGGIPTSEFRPLHEINPLRLDWIERIAGGLAGKRVVDVGCGGGILAEAMARAARKVTGIDLSAKRRSASRGCISSNPAVDVDYRLIAAEALARGDAGRIRRRHLHGDARARARPGVDRRRVRGAREARRHRRVLDDQPQSEVVLCSRSSAPNTCCDLLPRGTHDWARFMRPVRARRDSRAARGLDLARLTGMTYNPLTQDVSARAPTRRSTTWRRSAAADARCDLTPRPLPVAAVLFDLDGTLADTRRRPRRARSTACARDRGLPPVPIARRCARTRRPARAGCSARAWGSRPSIRDYAELRDAFLAHYDACLARDDARCSTASARCSTRSTRAACAGASSPTRPRATPRRVARARSALASRARRDRQRRHDAASEAASGAAAACGDGARRSRRRDCVYVGDDLRDIDAGNAAGMATIVARLRLHGRRRAIPDDGPRRLDRRAARPLALAAAARRDATRPALPATQLGTRPAR